MPKNATEIGKERRYRVPGTIDTTFPSVTTLLGAYPKDWMGPWAAKMVAEYAWDAYLASPSSAFSVDKDAVIKDLKGYPWRKRDEAADHGTAVHETFEQMNTGLPFAVPETMAAHIDPIRAWVDAYRPEVIWAECQVYNRLEAYAGSFDLYAEVYGRRYLIDLKTSKEPSWDSWSLQLNAYAFTDLIADGDAVLDQPTDIPWPEAAAVLWVPREKPDQWQFVEVPLSGAVYEAFLAVKHVYDYRASKPTGQLVLPQTQEAVA